MGSTRSKRFADFSGYAFVTGKPGQAASFVGFLYKCCHQATALMPKLGYFN